MPVIIDSTYLYEIKTILGYPKIDNVILSDSEISELCILPALRDYFTKFPIEDEVMYDISEVNEISFPDTDTFGVTHASFMNQGYTSGGTSFWEIVRYNSLYGNQGKVNNKWGTKYNFDMAGRSTQETLMQYVDSQNSRATTRVNVDQRKRKLFAYASIPSKLHVIWAKKSEDFSYVEYEYINDVIKLSQANYLYNIVNLVGMTSDSATEVDMSIDTMRDLADKITEEITEKWKLIPDVSLIQ